MQYSCPFHLVLYQIKKKKLEPHRSSLLVYLMLAGGQIEGFRKQRTLQGSIKVYFYKL
jgi:hypothetical protein